MALGNHSVMPYMQVGRPKYTRARIHILKLPRAAINSFLARGISPDDSCSSFCNNQSFSPSDSQAAALGVSGSTQYTTAPKTMAGRASKMNNHCHPASYPMCRTSNNPEMGLPITTARGFAVINHATARARAPDGNQRFM